MYFKDHASPTRRRFRFSSTAPRSPYNRRRTSRSSSERRRHAIHSSDSTSSSSDDEKFQRRRSKNRNRSVNKCLPMNFVKEDLLGIYKDRMKIGASLADVDPMNIDKTVRFDSIGGLSRHISALKEMVVFPLLYPEVFERFKIQPPRGCLFYGPPGTGKTLVARALANECSQGERKVSFFMRKGADCLSKWVGESERQLRLLFDQAYQMRPSIIFFDEIDGLAPVRSSRQDQIHSSIVSTLLALMDGLDGRGEIVVIGATNRLDTIDPALRRPGRFDREFLFGLPDKEARKDILKIHTRQWKPVPADAFLEDLADKCVGYCGADIKAMCSEAALCALRRRYPQIYSSSQKLVLDVNSIAIRNKDFMSAMSKMVPAAQRAVVSPAKALIPAIRPLLSTALQSILHTVSRVFPHAEQGLKRKREQSMVLLESKHERSGHSSHLAPAVLHALEKFTVYTLDMAVLFGTSATAPEETCAQIFVEAKRTSPSILYIPHIGQWWETVGPALRATFLSLLSSIPAFSPILLLATCNLRYDQLSMEVQELFRMEYGEVFHVQVPTSRERRNFFEDLILNQAAKSPASKKKSVLHVMEVLPVAPPPPPRQLTVEEIQKLEEQEENTLRELRLFLRDVTNRLSQDKRFKAFTKPVDLDEVPDYAEVIKKPMDLSTVLSKIDLHRYGTVKEFLEDVDLIWQNALEYNPDRDPSDRQIRHRACALKDTVHAIITDELDEDFEKICEEIKESRSTRGHFSSNIECRKTNNLHTITSHRKKRRKSRWSTGFYAKKKSSPHVSRDDAQLGSDEDEEDGDDEEEAEKETGAELDEGTGEEEDQIVVYIESGSAEAQEAREPYIQEEKGADDKVTLCGSKKNKNDNHMHIEKEKVDKSLTCQPLQTEENNKAMAGGKDDCTETISATNNKDSHAETGGNTLGQSSIEQSGGTNHQKLPETETDKCQTRRLANDSNYKVAATQDTELKGQFESSFIYFSWLSATHFSLPFLQELLERVVTKTEGYEVFKLEKLYALLCQSIYRHRRDFNKTTLIQVGF
uniref:ATPase family AAA domain-containing protein 2 n=1 Tax=Echeneis naucrates TaxID=173247 RepID=A0A665TM09_ECHNA